MDPLLDEKIIVTISNTIPIFFMETLDLSARREAYGPSKNEGLCYEKCASIKFSGEFGGVFYFGMDGYTKIKLLPHIAKAFDMSSFKNLSSSMILMEFTTQIFGQAVTDLIDAGFSLSMEPPLNLDNKLIAIDRRTLRQYIIIFNLQVPEEKNYLGRLYAIITLNKIDSGFVKNLDSQENIKPNYKEEIDPLKPNLT